MKEENQDLLDRLLPKLVWMNSLERLVLIKLGTHATDGTRVSSILLKTLLLFLLCLKEDCAHPLRVLWVQDFEVDRCGTLPYLNHKILRSYGFGDYDGPEEEDEYESFQNLVHLGGRYANNFSLPHSSLKKLKYVSGTYYDDKKVNKTFIRTGFSAGKLLVKILSFLSFTNSARNMLNSNI